MTALRTQATRTFGRIREAVSDMNYAQWRLLEVSRGIPAERSQYRRSARREIDELEALFRLSRVNSWE